MGMWFKRVVTLLEEVRQAVVAKCGIQDLELGSRRSGEIVAGKWVRREALVVEGLISEQVGL